MLVSLDRLLRRRRGPPEVDRLRARFAAQPGRLSSGRRDRRRAAELVSLKEELARSFSEAQSCRRCDQSAGRPGFEGGRCCGTSTLTVFSRAEVRALKLAGRSLRPPAEDHGPGCVYRGRSGCSLAPADRPIVCLVYACESLSEEVWASSERESVRRLRVELRDRFEAIDRA